MGGVMSDIHMLLLLLLLWGITLALLAKFNSDKRDLECKVMFLEAYIKSYKKGVEGK